MSYVDMGLTALLVQLAAEATRYAIRWLRGKASRLPPLPPPDHRPPQAPPPPPPPTGPTP